MTIDKTTRITQTSPTSLLVERYFDAPQPLVWQAWTDASLLDQWWAPGPWKAITKNLDFRPGGAWLYCMQGPDGTRSWCRVDYRSITEGEGYVTDNAFCDEDGTITDAIPAMHWENHFSAQGAGTLVTVAISFANEADLGTIVAMGFKQGFTMGHGNLDALLQRMLAA